MDRIKEGRDIMWRLLFLAVLLLVALITQCEADPAVEDWTVKDNLILAQIGVPTGIAYRHSFIYDFENWLFAFHRVGCELACDKYTSLNAVSLLGGDGWWIGGGPQWNISRMTLEFVLLTEVRIDGISLFWDGTYIDDHIWVTPRVVLGEDWRVGFSLGIGGGWKSGDERR